MANPPEVALVKLAESLYLLNRALGHLNELRRSDTSPELRTAVEQLRQVAYDLDGFRLDVEQTARQRRERRREG